MRRAAAGIGVLVLMITACASRDKGTGADGSSNAPAPPSPVPSSAPPTTGLPPGATGPAVPSRQVDFSRLPADYPHSLWTTDDGRTVVVSGEQSGCSRLTGEPSAQSSTEVDITLVSVTTTQLNCPLHVRFVPVPVRLDAPLGARKIVLTTRVDHA
ncbi:MAG: hypothetical protein JOZ47_16570 [Kutzneria sp.]|nr:hypothetical protein [Kutzneria sp.]MBV9846662.1 hypothetical protein [Kutzneria sp.]